MDTLNTKLNTLKNNSLTKKNQEEHDIIKAKIYKESRNFRDWKLQANRTEL